MSATSNHTQYDYMTKDKLLKNSREMAEKMHAMQVKLKRLEQYKKEEFSWKQY